MKEVKVVKFVREIHKKTFSMKPSKKKISEKLKLCIYIALIQDVESFEKTTEYFLTVANKLDFEVVWNQYNKLKSIARSLQDDGHLVDRNLLHRLNYVVAKFASSETKELIIITD
jgi:hypothetical protein